MLYPWCRDRCRTCIEEVNYASDQSHDRNTRAPISTKPVWGPVIELVDLRYRPEVNTIGALAESDPSEHAPLAEPIWITTPEESGFGP